MRTAGIILAAGRGSRMLERTADRPKCLVELAGRPLLAWQLDALAALDDILVVRGYQAEKLNGPFATVDNPDWESTNMLSSLLCAAPYARGFFSSGGDRIVVSYSDIVYNPGHIERLLGARADIAITYDTLWQALWELRFDDALSDAETFRQEDGRLVEIGGRAASVAEIHGQYMGLLSFSKAGWREMEQICANLGTRVAKTDMTAFLRFLLQAGVPVEAVPVNGKWCESDSGADVQAYEAALTQGNWSHDWR